MRIRLVEYCLCAATLLGVSGRAVGQPSPWSPEEFVKLHRLIKPQEGESRFQEIPWLLSVWEARKQAAREGKPILVWAGAGGAPTAVC